MTKLCKDCRHYQLGFLRRVLFGSAYEHAKCGFFKKSTKVSMVTGIPEESDLRFYCSTARGIDTLCDKNGNSWEAR